ncbi:uncharacterized protein LOC135944524 [Cloeon dipterum]|uniref:uncharacterized protein LOC135944524 n=1 Tax=Cloeon dipterum TaxID=197152 RepID=UPI00321F7FE9
MITTSSTILVALALCSALASSAPQNFYYFQPPFNNQHQQHQQQQYQYPQPYQQYQHQPQYSQRQQQQFFGGQAAPFPFPYQGGYPAPASYNPAYNFNPGYSTSSVQSYGPVPPHQYYSPPQQQPQYVFVYPGNPYQPYPGTPAARPPPVDDTGDAEVFNTLGSMEHTDQDVSNERREPLAPEVAVSGPEVGRRGMPEKSVAAKKPQRVQKLVDQPKAEVEQSAEEKVDDDVDTIVVDVDDTEFDGGSDKNDDKSWHRRLAPSLQSVYVEADDNGRAGIKAPTAGSGGSVVVGDDAHSGPSVASVKPAAIALAGPGGVASAAPVGTAVVGPGGLAVAAPSATAVAGPTSGVPPGVLGGAASARSNFRLHQMLDKMYAAPARRAAFRSAAAYNLQDFY